MGIDNSAARMILLLKGTPGADFGDVLTFGHQRNYIGRSLKKQIGREFNASLDSLNKPYADDFLTVVGARNLSTLDVSDYEGATVIHDLNIAIPNSLREKYSVVLDIGTTEHVFNVFQAQQNMKDMCKVGGHVLAVSPANNYLGHGFYQFSPELFFRSFDEASGFELIDLFLIKKGILRDAWFRLNDPKNMRRRGNIQTPKRCYVAAIARKISTEGASVAPQQSDYESTWEKSEVSKYGALYLRMPGPIRKILELTLIALLGRYRNRLTGVDFHWSDGNLVIGNRIP